MPTHPMTDHCAVCGNAFPIAELRSLADLTAGPRQSIMSAHPDLPGDALICRTDLARFRREHVEGMLSEERGALSALDRAVLDSLQTGIPLTGAPPDADTAPRSLGERAADGLASFGGSWTFIIGFGVVLIFWVTLNATGLLFGPFDPYPFILLNLVLSSLAALQAPIIMMSQRRQEQKDRQRSENDYKINLKAELEIRHLHDKVDMHLTRQWERLTAIQELQIELLEEAAKANRT